MEFYDEVDNENNYKFAYYILSIKWKIDKILDKNQENGFIIQEVDFTNNTGIELTYKEDNEENCYYEAWEVKNRKIIETGQNKFDDAFSHFNEYDILSYLSKSLGKVGEIKYKSKVYWINETDNLYKKIKKWKYIVPMSGGLKAIYKKDFCELEKNYKPKFYRPDFIHQVDFKKHDIILDSIMEIFEVRIKKKDKTLIEDLRNEIDNKDYEYIIDIIEKKLD